MAVQQFSGNGGKSHLWVFVPDNEGFNFIVNFHSGQVLDVSDNSLKNYATVRQFPLNGGESQRGSFSTRSLKLEGHVGKGAAQPDLPILEFYTRLLRSAEHQL